MSTLSLSVLLLTVIQTEIPGQGQDDRIDYANRFFGGTDYVRETLYTSCVAHIIRFSTLILPCPGSAWSSSKDSALLQEPAVQLSHPHHLCPLKILQSHSKPVYGTY